MCPGADALADGGAGLEDDRRLAAREEVCGGSEPDGAGADDGNR
jgi:hypothetical protein